MIECQRCKKSDEKFSEEPEHFVGDVSLGFGIFTQLCKKCLRTWAQSACLMPEPDEIGLLTLHINMMKKKGDVEKALELYQRKTEVQNNFNRKLLAWLNGN